MLRISNNESRAEELLHWIRNADATFLVFIGSTKTSTISGISIAGASPQETLYTPALDVEYLVEGFPISIKEVPVTPEGIPTPALITRSVLTSLKIPYLIVDTGSFLEPKIPHVVLPSRHVGDSIASCKAMPYEVVKNLFRESGVLARQIARYSRVFVVSESIPGGTTAALGILRGLGYNASGLVSSASPKNPASLKDSLVRKCLESERCNLPTEDPFKAVSCLGDPVHVSIAGFTYEALKQGAAVLLAGGTQMAAVLAILKAVDRGILKKNVGIGTTSWILKDPSSDIVKLIQMIDGEVPVIAYNYDFSNSPYEGLRYYERGYVKEGVGAGGIGVVAEAKGLDTEEIHNLIYEEYERLLNLLRK
jgi:uncharacterized protein (TIGR00303 family)